MDEGGQSGRIDLSIDQGISLRCTAEAGTIMSGAQGKGRGDALIFLPASGEIANRQTICARPNLRHTEILPLYGRGLSVGPEQQKIFARMRAAEVGAGHHVAELIDGYRVSFVFLDPGLRRRISR